MHTLISLTRLLYAVLGNSYWLKAYDDIDKIKDVNEEFIAETETAVKTTIIAIIALGCMLDLLIWKRRAYAKGLIYYELVFIIVISFVPFDYGQVVSPTMLFTFVMLHLGYSCDIVFNTFAVTIAHSLSSILIYPNIYNQDLTSKVILVKFWDSFMVFVSCFCISLAVTYVV